MELTQRGEVASVYDGYQRASTVTAFGSASTKNGVTSTSFGPSAVSAAKMSGGESEPGSAERLKLLQLKTPSYATTGDGVQRRSINDEDGASTVPQLTQDAFESLDSSFTAILSLDGSDDGSGSPSRPQSSRRRKSSVPFSSTAPSVQIWGYRRDPCLFAITIWLSLLTCGFFALILYWKPKLLAAMTALQCKLSEASLILIEDEHDQWSLETVQTIHRSDGITFLDVGGAPATAPSLRVFDHRKLRFVWHPKHCQFQVLGDFDQRCPLSVYFQRQELGLTQQMTLARSTCYGFNEMRVELTPVVQLLFRECLQPLSIFQAFSVILWFTQTYYLFSCVIILMTAISWAMNVYTTRKSQSDLRRMVGSSGRVSILRDGVVQKLSSKSLVPGDVVVLDPDVDCGQNVDYDGVIISGGCVTNESSLTGESVPVTKTSLFYADGAPKEIFDYQAHGKHLLYAGSKLLQIRSSVAHPAKLVVIRTGFHTAKGRLVRSILFPKPIDYRFIKDLIVFLLILSVVGVMGMVYSIVVLWKQVATYMIIEHTLSIITIVVPPLLPAAMSIGVVLAQNRLRKKRIYCISASTINACGSVDAVCFDKTGTLTEDGLELTQVRTVARGRFDDQKSARDVSGFSLSGQGNEKHLVRLMASCHTLVLLEHDEVGTSRSEHRIGGDPIDLALFEKTSWRLIKPSGLTIVQYPGCVGVVEEPTTAAIGVDREKFLILQQFIFTSNLKRMSVIVRDQITGTYSAYCKGAPETIKSLCLPETLPPDYDTVLADYTKEGCRVISLAVKKLSKNGPEASDFDVRHWSRDKVERDMVFLGFAILENQLKPATTPIIHQLNNANIRTIMITGDHVDTAIHVARKCGISPLDKKLYLIEYDQQNRHPILRHVPVPNNTEAPRDERRLLESVDFESGGILTYQFAITGPVFAELCIERPDSLARLAAVCSVYARMAPDQKTQVVSLLQNIGYVVSACGDGANDCGALKTSHAGISLSEAEASVASPFTSQIGDISCVPTLISEGRAALVTSFGLAKYMVAYSLIQLFTTCLAYSILSDLANNHFVFADLVLVTLASIAFGRVPAEEQLSVKQPSNRLISPPVIIGVLLHAAASFLFQAMAFAVVTQQSWFDGTVQGDKEHYGKDKSMQVTVAFQASMFQYVWMALILSKGRPYRKPLYYNWMLLTMSFVQLALCIWLTLDASQTVSNFMYFIPAPDEFYRICQVGLAFVNLLVYIIIEVAIIDWLFSKKFDNKQAGLITTWLSGRSQQAPTYERIIRLVGDSPNWLTSTQAKI